MNLVNRLIRNHPDKQIISLNPLMCPCLTMNRIDLPHLLWSLESIVNGEEVNVIKVDNETALYAIRCTGADVGKSIGIMERHLVGCLFVYGVAKYEAIRG